MVHVAMVNHAFRPIPPEPGDSPAIVLDRLARALVRRGVRVTAVGGPGPSLFDEYEVIATRPGAWARSAGPAGLEVAFAVEAGRAIRRLRPDVVHHHASTPAALGRVGRDVPSVLSYAAPVGIEGRAPTWGSLSRISEVVEEVACRRAGHVIAVSSLTAAFLRTRYRVPSRRMSVIPNGVDTAAFAPAGIATDPRTLVCVARIAPYKDQATLVRSLATPPLRQRQVRALLVGPLDDAGYVRHLKRLAADLGVADRVDLCGRREIEELPALYGSAAIVVAPSRAEGMPLALLEAMSCGRAVVASAIPQHLEVGPAAGVTFFPPGDPGALGEAVARLLDDARLRAMMETEARATVIGRYSWDSVAERVEALYARVIAATAGTSR